MKAYQWDGTGHSSLVLKDVPVPEPGPAEVQIKIKACGLCHSDCHILDGSGAQWIKQRPITLGHEVSAQITKLGERVTDLFVGQRVGIALIPPATALGLDFNGGYAEYAVAPSHTVVPLPENLSYEQACVAVDAMASGYHAVVGTAGVTPGMTVGVIGLGGLGMTGFRTAVITGAKTYACDLDTEKIEIAKKAGAVAVSTDISKFKDVVFDVIFDFVGFEKTMLAAIEAVKREGVIVLVGMGSPNMNLPAGQIVMKNIEIRGSLGGRKHELGAIFDLIASGKLVPEIEEVPFDQLNESLHRLEAGKASKRMYVKPNGPE